MDVLNPTPTRVRIARMIPLIALATALTGCRQEQVTRYKVPKEAPPAMHMHAEGDGHDHGAMPEAPPAPPSDGGDTLAPPPKPQGGLKWTLPKGWAEEKGSGMRYASLKVPGPGKVDASVVVLAGAAGGELANVNRWRGQIGLGPIDEAALGQARKVVKCKAGAISTFDFTSDGTVKSRMVAGLISTADGNTWFLKMVGDADPVGKAKPEFLRLMESARLD